MREDLSEALWPDVEAGSPAAVLAGGVAEFAGEESAKLIAPCGSTGATGADCGMGLPAMDGVPGAAFVLPDNAREPVPAAGAGEFLLPATDRPPCPIAKNAAVSATSTANSTAARMKIFRDTNGEKYATRSSQCNRYNVTKSSLGAQPTDPGSGSGIVTET